MAECEASRTLVKSPPELWAECSDAAALGRHLDSFGEIRITKLEPETVVAWEGERISGTVRLEPSGWGTRVVLTARAALDQHYPRGMEERAREQLPRIAGPGSSLPQPPAPQPPARGGLRERVRSMLGLRAMDVQVPGEQPLEFGTDAGSEPSVAPDAETALTEALDSLGQAHHRPFSRA
jgi:hypothetical protein